MHDKTKHNGNYVNFPSGVTETNRDVNTLKAGIMAGFDAIFQVIVFCICFLLFRSKCASSMFCIIHLQFNQLGFHQENYQNAVLGNSGDISSFKQAVDFVKKFTDFSAPENLFIKPQVGYFGNVGDYNGAVSPSGVLREKYNQLRRVNLFLSAFETRIAAAGQGKRTVFPRDDSLKKMDYSVIIEDKRIGVSACNY
jgi:hypothetical protein